MRLCNLKVNREAARDFSFIHKKKYLILFIFIYFLLGVGLTYSYFAYQVQNDSVIAGNVIAIDADLKVELVVGNNNGMVPMMDNALSNALNAVGTTNGACIDSNGNLSCQVYKITLTNNGSALKNLKGSIELSAKAGSNNAYSNLKWTEITNPTTLKEGAVVNGMSKSTLVTNLTMASKEEKVWYISVWISETDADQTNTDKGEFQGTVTFETYQSNIFAETIMEPSAQSDESLDFSQSSEESNTNGIYVRSGTENNLNPIYYYRGNVNNNLIFADICWKIVRTTETGGLKLLYNGVSTDGTCNNTGTHSIIGHQTFNSSDTSPAYVGYMYSTVYTGSSKPMSSETNTYYYGNSVTYSGGTYTLVDTISSADWSSIYDGGLDNNHYTCFSTGTTCSSIYYIYYTDSSTAYYITLTNGKTVEDALVDMLGADDENTANYNTTSSTVKGNSTTEGTLDYWYYNDIVQRGYSDYIEDTVWCNDRSIFYSAGWDPNGGTTRVELLFETMFRSGMITTYTPSLTCSRDIDKFTVSTDTGNGALDYPVGLLTMDEVMLAGGRSNTDNSTYYLYNGAGRATWLGSPYSFYEDHAYVFFVPNGELSAYYVNTDFEIRPSISLNSGFSLTGNGDGTVNNPYIVDAVSSVPNPNPPMGGGEPS